jgi:hypothetical protein
MAVECRLLRFATVKTARLALLAVTMIAVVSAAASAQTDSRFAAGAQVMIGVSDRASTEDHANAQVFPDFLWRFGEIKPGWGPHWGLNWYALDIERPIGGQVTELGELHVRPIMAGYGYTWIRGRNTIATNALAGYAFGSMDLSPKATDAYRARLGVDTTDASATNTFVLRPEIDFWHDINKLFGLNINVGYIIARPDVTVTTSTGVDTRTARADQFQVRVGIVYSIF